MQIVDVIVSANVLYLAQTNDVISRLRFKTNFIISQLYIVNICFSELKVDSLIHP